MKMNKKRPYVIQSITLLTYNGSKIPVSVVEERIIDIPIRIIKEKVLDAFSSMKDNPVDVILKVKYVYLNAHKSNENKRRTVGYESRRTCQLYC